jgi:hypothetical protein
MSKKEKIKTLMDVMESHIGGTIELTKFISKMKEYNPKNQESMESCKIKAYDHLMAYSYMEGADKSKYGSLLSGLQTQYLLGNNQYPQMITDANSVLSNHKFDNMNKNKHSMVKNESINDNAVEDNSELSFSQLDGKCHCCRKPSQKSQNVGRKANLDKIGQ